MAPRRIESLEVSGFLSIAQADIELGDITVVIGANGAGKSNLVRVFELLGRIVDEELDLYVGVNGGASGLLYRGPTSAETVRITLHFSPFSYQAALVPNSEDEFVFAGETVGETGPPGRFPFRHDMGSGYRQTALTRISAENAEAGTALSVRDTLAGCRVYHFHDTNRDAPVKRFVSAADNISLASDAANLAAVLLRVSEEDPPAYHRIVGGIRLVAPFFRDFVLKEERGDNIRLRWRQEGSDSVFSAHALSDGTLRFICLATLLGLPEMPRLVVLDEPELGLHPYAIVQLADMIRSASTRSQVLLATQSVTLLDQFAIDELVIAERHHGASVFSRPDVVRLDEWLDDYSLGQLWEKNVLGGRPRAESTG